MSQSSRSDEPRRSRPGNLAAGALRQAVQDTSRAAYRDAILDAAGRIFQHDGLHGARVAEIAKVAGISVGTVYNHFPSKEELYRALCARNTERFLEAARVESAASPRQALLETVKCMLRFIQQSGPVFLRYTHRSMLTDAEAALLKDDEGLGLQQCLLAHFEPHILAAVRAGELRSDIPTSVLVNGYFALVAGIVNTWLSAPETNMEEAAEAMFHLYIQGAGPR